MFLVKPKTVDSAVSSLLTALTNLEHVAALHNTQLAENLTEQTRLQAEADVHRTEITRAETIAEKIGSIVYGD